MKPVAGRAGPEDDVHAAEPAPAKPIIPDGSTRIYDFDATAATPDPAPRLLTAPAVTRLANLPAQAIREYHAVAKCRWCGSPFYAVYNRRHWLCDSAACAERQLADAVMGADATVTRGDSPYLFVPLPLQIDIDRDTTKHLLVAGAAGVSKSYGARWNLYRRCRQIEGYRALLLRRTFPELEKNHLQYMYAEAIYLGDASYRGGNIREMRFNSGSTIFAGYCDDENDLQRHVGPEWDECVFEEAVTFDPRAINEISPRARGSEPARASMRAAGLKSRTRLYSNPGGVAMRYLVDTYITKDPDRDDYPHYQPDNYGHIHCTLEDNPFLAEDYEQTDLSGLSAARFQQLRHGDWTVYAGQFFDRFDSSVHVVRAEAS